MDRRNFEAANMIHKQNALQFGEFPVMKREKDAKALPPSPFFFNLHAETNPEPGSLKSTDLQMIANRMDIMINFDQPLVYANIAGIPEAGKKIVETMVWVWPCRFSRKTLSLKKIDVLGGKPRFLIDRADCYHRGAKVLMVNDLIDEAGPSLEVIIALRKADCVIEDLVVLVDCELGGKKALAEAGVKLHSVFTASELFAYYYSRGWIDKKTMNKCMKYLKR